MVKVYFENADWSYAELVAVFDSSEIYMACLPTLEDMAKKNGFERVTESVEVGPLLLDS